MESDAALFPAGTGALPPAVFHGGDVHSRTPACGACPVARLCPSYGIGVIDPVAARRLVKGPAQEAADAAAALGSGA